MTEKITEKKKSVYVIMTANGQYFAGFDPNEGVATLVDDPIDAKWYTNRFAINLRPQEAIVELIIESVQYSTSKPFRLNKHRNKRNDD